MGTSGRLASGSGCPRKEARCEPLIAPLFCGGHGDYRGARKGKIMIVTTFGGTTTGKRPRSCVAGGRLAQEKIGQLEVAGVGDLDVVLAALDRADRHLGEVAAHDTAVIGRTAEARVGGGQLVGAGDHREPESL